jgi:flagellar hook-basal body complex protein FliE
MASPILPISPAILPQAIQPAAAPSGGSAFKDVFSSAIQQVESFSQDAGKSVERFLSGEGEELHTAVMATNRAELAFDMLLQTRNKVVSAYQEIMKLQV